MNASPPTTTCLPGPSSPPTDADIAPEWEAFLGALARPSARHRIQTLMSRGLHQLGDVETRLGYHVGTLGDSD